MNLTGFDEGGSKPWEWVSLIDMIHFLESSTFLENVGEY